MTSVVLDTSAISNFLKRDAEQRWPDLVQAMGRLLAGVGDEDEALISIMTRYELLRGLHVMEQRGQGRRLRRRAETVLRQCTLVDFGPLVCDVAARLYARADQHEPSIVLGEADLVIAATAAAIPEAELWTTDAKLVRNLALVAPELRVRGFARA